MESIYPRLMFCRWWNIPFPELILLLVGVALMWIYPDLTNLNIAGIIVAAAAGIGLLVGTPLLAVRVNVFWCEACYLIAGVGVGIYLSFIDYVPGFGLGLVAALAVGAFVAGVSYVARRALALVMFRRRLGSGDSGVA